MEATLDASRRFSASTRAAAGITFSELLAAGAWAIALGLPEVAAGAGAVEGVPLPAPSSAMASPTLAISPFLRRIFWSTPSAGAGSSMVAFSDSMVTRFSSLRMVLPSGFSHSPIWTSVTDSPTGGIFSSVAIVRDEGKLRRVESGECPGEQFRLFLPMAIVRAGSGAGGGRSADDLDGKTSQKPFSKDLS